MTRRAIVVEDQPHVLAGLARLLSDVLGYSVAPEDQCSTLEEGVAALSRAPIPALVICDVYIPSKEDLNGADLASAIKQPGPLMRVPVVVISGMMPEDSPDVRHASRAGAAYLAKPFIVAQLRAAIAEAQLSRPTDSHSFASLTASMSIDTLP
jgi:CheY-like chemotaxis protein